MKDAKPSKPRFFYSAGGQEIQLWMIFSHYAAQFIGLHVKAGDSIVDTAAEDGCVGHTQLEKITESLQPFGLRWVWVEGDEAQRCSGIGGGAVAAGAIEVPVGIAGLSGILKLTVLRDSEQAAVPLLLPINLMKELGFLIDLAGDACTLQAEPLPDGTARTAPMSYLPSGHCTISIVDFGPEGWVRQRMRMATGFAFRLRARRRTRP